MPLKLPESFLNKFRYHKPLVELGFVYEATREHPSPSTYQEHGYAHPLHVSGDPLKRLLAILHPSRKEQHSCVFLYGPRHLTRACYSEEDLGKEVVYYRRMIEDDKNV